MSKELALIAARNERNKKKKKEENKLQLQAPVNAITNTINKTVGKPQNKKTTVNKAAKQSTTQRTQTNTLQRSSNVKEMPTFSPNDNRTVKANKKKKSVQTFDVYERGGKYFYEENGKEIPIKKSYLKNALNTNRRGVVGNFDENGKFTETNSRGVPLNQAPKEEAKKYKKEARQAARDKSITNIANKIESSPIYKGLKTAGNTATNMGYGALKQGVEGPLDFAQSISDWINNSAEEKAKVALGMRTADEARREREEAERQQSEWTGKSLTDEGLKKAGWNEDLWNQWEDGSAVRRDNIAGQIAQAVGGMMPSIYAGKALGFNNTYNVPLKGLKGAELAKGIGKNVGMSLLSNAGGNAVLGASAYGNAYEEAVNNGATPEQARNYATLNAGTEFATEMITGGIPGLKQTGILDNMADGLIDKATGKVTNKFLKQATAALLKMGYSFAGEGFEEALSDIINPMIKNATYTDGEKINWQDVWRDFFIGGASGLILGGSNDVMEGINLANQQIQELNTMADQRIQQLQQEVQQDPSKAQEAVQEIQNIENYVQAQTNIIQNQAQTQSQESETTQPNTITQKTQNVAQNEQNEGTQESAFNNETNDYEEYQNKLKSQIEQARKTIGDEFADNLEKQRQEYNERHQLENSVYETTKSKPVDNDKINDSFFKEHTSDFDGKTGTKTQDGTITSMKLQKGDNLAKVTYTEGKDKIWIDELYVKNQNQGYGSEIVNAIKDYANKEGKYVDTFKELTSANGFWNKVLDRNTDVKTTKNENIPTTKENVINEEAKQQQETTNEIVNQNNEEQQETTETTQQEERKQPEILDKMPTEKKSTIKSLKKGIDTFRKEITDNFAGVYDMSRKYRNPTLYHKADAILKSDGYAQIDLGSNQVNLRGKPFNNFTDEKGNKTTMSWEQTYDAYKEIPNKAKNEYLVHNLNIDRLNQGVDQFGISLEESQQRLEELRNQYKNIDKWSENPYQFYRNLIQNMVDNGRISQELADKWLKETPHFVHIERQVPNKGNQGVSVKKGKVDSDNLFRKIKGGNYAILPIKETTAKYVQNSRRAFAFNDFGKEYARTIGVDAKGDRVSADTDIDEIFGLEPEIVNKDGQGNYTMKIYEKGMPVEIPINEDVYNSLSPKNIPRVPILADATNVYKDLLTNKNPFFGFLRNPIRDAKDMFLYSKFSMPKSIATYGKLFGGRTALRNRTITRDGVTAQDIVNFYNNNGNGSHSFYKNGQFKSEKGKIRKGADKVLSPIEKGGDFMESMPRITEYWNTIESNGYTIKDGELVPREGKNPTKTVDQVLAEASYNAADVTVNFKRGGRTSKVISQNGGIFFNPSVQGTSKFVRTFTEAIGDARAGDFQAAKRLVLRAAALGVAPAVLSEVMYGDDDEYKEIQDYQKDQYFLIKGSDGKWTRIPRGRALSLFQSATRRGIEKAKGREDAFKGYGQFTINQMAPNNPLDSNIFSPLTAAATNKSWSGNKIVSDSMAKRPVEEQFNEKTDEFSKWIGKKLHISPMKVNYVIDQYSGVLGDLALPQITPKATTGSSNPIMNILRDNYSFDSANSSKSLNDFYETKSKIQTKARGINATDKDKLQSKYLGTQSQEMYNLYTEKQKIQMDNSLSKKEKYDQALEVQKKINKKAKDAIKGSKDIDINKNYATVGDDTYYKDSGDWKKESEKTTQRREELGLTADKYYYYRNEEAYKKPDGKYKYITSGENAKRNIAIVDAFDFDTSDYLEYTYKLSQIKSDKNSSGKTIRNSRKPKVIKYIQSLPISKAQKEYLYKTQYSSYRSGDSDLTKQISKSNLSKKEKEEIYSYLGLGR